MVCSGYLLAVTLSGNNPIRDLPGDGLMSLIVSKARHRRKVWTRQLQNPRSGLHKQPIKGLLIRTPAWPNSTVMKRIAVEPDAQRQLRFVFANCDLARDDPLVTKV